MRLYIGVGDTDSPTFWREAEKGRVLGGRHRDEIEQAAIERARQLFGSPSDLVDPKKTLFKMNDQTSKHREAPNFLFAIYPWGRKV
jgi:hypothetical protein